MGLKFLLFLIGIIVKFKNLKLFFKLCIFFLRRLLKNVLGSLIGFSRMCLERLVWGRVF